MSPIPAPAPAPVPVSVPPTATSFQTSEYNKSTGPSYHRAIGAWQLGATGKGVAIGIIDTGIDTTNPEFAGRISGASADVASSRGVNPEDGHGTMVALVAAAARNGTGIMGIAYEATVIGLRADTPGSCGESEGCSFGDRAIAAGIDRAVTNGAKVVNLSLGGGGGAGSQTRAAVERAAAAGVVVVVAAGNDADAPEPSSDPNNPDPFAVSLRASGNGNVIIAGSVNASGTLSSFSNRAGNEANWYLNALGEGICCEYENGAIKITSSNGQQFQTVYNGTSFSAPQIAGAAALLRQAFPNLTANQVVNLLLSTARDAGASGTDATYGRGILDITNAFAPQGQTSLAGTNAIMPINSTSIVTSEAMGDALTQTELKTIVLDAYARAYAVDLATNGRSSFATANLIGALSSRLRHVETKTDRLALAFSVQQPHVMARNTGVGELRLSRQDGEPGKVVAARVIAHLTPKTSIGFSSAQGSNGLVAQLRGQKRPTFLTATDPLDDVGFKRRAQTLVAIRQELGRTGLTVHLENGRVATASLDRNYHLQRQQSDGFLTRRSEVALDRSFGSITSGLALSWLKENRTILGARLQDALGGAGADSFFVDANVAWSPAAGWRIGGAWRQGYTRARIGGRVRSGSTLISNAWAFDASRHGVFTEQDSLSFRLSQPLRVAAGGVNFSLPTGYSYDTLSATEGLRRLVLTPKGRELTAELGWRGKLGPGWATGTVFYQRNPGHFALSPDDKGVALSWSGRF